MLIGASIKFYAVSPIFEGSSLDTALQTAWNFFPFYEGMPSSAKLAAIGFMLFGCGVEMAGITVSKGIVKWFKGKEMALAMGLEMAIARIGVAAAVLISPFFARLGGTVDVSRSVLFSVILLLIGLICFIVYFFMDKKLEKEMGDSGEEPEEPFQIKDLGKIFSSGVFWLVALLCVLYYSAIFPFQKYAINMLQCNLGFTEEKAGLVFSVFPLGAALITPLLGFFLDYKGRGATMLIFGALLLIICHVTFALVLPALKGTALGTAIGLNAIVLLGISFSLVPASLWPSVPKLVDNRLLGSAYAVIFWIQNIGLWLFPLLIGKVLKASNPEVEQALASGQLTPTEAAVSYNYTNALLMLAMLGVAALVLGILLKAVDKKHHLGLEEPNIKPQ